MIDVRRLRMLRAVVETGSVAGAATELGYTSSAISQQISALERQAGVALLDRVGRGVVPTAAGRLLAEHAVHVDQELDNAEAAMAALRTGSAGRVRLSYFTTAGATLIGPGVAWLRHTRPGLEINLSLAEAEDPLRAVLTGQVDAAVVVTAAPTTSAGLEMVRLLEDPYRAVLPKDHPASARRTVPLADLVDEPWIGCERPGPCQDTFLAGCARVGITPRFTTRAEDYATAGAFVAASLGIALIPRAGLATFRHADVAIRRLSRPAPTRTIQVATRRGASDQPHIAAVIAALRGAARAIPADP